MPHGEKSTVSPTLIEQTNLAAHGESARGV